MIVVPMFYIGWFGSVFLARTDFAWASIFLPAMMLAYLVFKKLLSLRAFGAAMAITGVGTLVDSAMANADFISIPAQTSWLIPLWLVSIWLLFSFSMTQLGQWLNVPLWASALLGAIVGPLSYKSGEIFKVLFFTSQNALWIYALVWMIAFPLIVKTSRWAI